MCRGISMATPPQYPSDVANHCRVQSNRGTLFSVCPELASFDSHTDVVPPIRDLELGLITGRAICRRFRHRSEPSTNSIPDTTFETAGDRGLLIPVGNLPCACRQQNETRSACATERPYCVITAHAPRVRQGANCTSSLSNVCARPFAHATLVVSSNRYAVGPSSQLGDFASKSGI
jgi:hypothetical protein